MFLLTFDEGGFTMADVLDMTHDEIMGYVKRYSRHWKRVARASKKG